MVPERFSAKVSIEPDASYTFRYVGTAVNVLAAEQLKQKGSLSEQDQIYLKAEAENIAKIPEIRKAVYKGNARYDLEIETKKKTGQSLSMFNIFSVSTDKNGVITISSVEFKDGDKKEFEKVGISVEGALEVSLPKNAEVISHNATSTPTFGIFGTYSWKIGRIDQRPMMKLRFKQ